MPTRSAVGLLLLSVAISAAEPPALHLDFAEDTPDMRLARGAKRVAGAVEFTNHLQYAEVPFARKLDGEAGILGRPVHLFLRVKVSERWQENRERYSALGLDFDAS